MVGAKLVEALKVQISGERALAYATEIAKFHRAKGSSDYRRAVEYVREKLVSWGLERVTVEKYPADGKRTYQTWTPAPAWEPVSAELSLVYPVERPICSFETEPLSLVFGSTSTPPRGLTLEVVDIGDGSDDEVFAAREVYGKVVLTSQDARVAFQKAIKKRGAVGVLTDFMPRKDPSIGRTPYDLPDAVNYASFPIKGEDIGKVTFGFSLSHRQAQELRALLKQGQVKVRAVVDADLFPGNLEVLTGVIPGTEDGGEVLVIAHLCHPKPGACDNASGCGLAMELARALVTGINHGRLASPCHSIRFMFVPEMYGTIAYLERHPRWPKRVKAGVNLDMVGESREAMSTANLVSTPWSLPSPLSDVGAFYMDAVGSDCRMYEGSERMKAWHYCVTGFAGGSDHYILVDSSFKVPCVHLGHWPDRFYHSSMDTTSRLDADELLRMGLVAGATILTFADPGLESARFILGAAEAGARGRAIRAATEALDAAMSSHDPTKTKETITKFFERAEILLEKEIAALDWIRRFASKADERELRTVIRGLKRGIRTAFRTSRENLGLLAGHPRNGAGDLSTEGRAGRFWDRIYTRLFKGPLDPRYLYERMDEKRREHYEKRQRDDPSFQLRFIETLNYMDGKRTIGRIATLVSAEYPGCDFGDLRGFVEDLETVGLVCRK